jgi:hypothetical protein
MSKFVNFPLFLIQDTLTDPKDAMEKIACFVLVEYAKRCQRDYKEGLVQACYQAQQKPDLTFSRDVARIMERDDVDEFAWTHFDPDLPWPIGAKDESYALFVLKNDPTECEMDAAEQAALVAWLALRDSAHYFNRRIHDFDSLFRSSSKAKIKIDKHEQAHGPLAFATCPADYFFETWKKTADIEAMRLFRCVCAVRSVIGKKPFTGTTKDMLRARMIGAKTPAIAKAMAADSLAIRTELDSLASRSRFDRILTEGAVRKFYCKFGIGRRVYLSTEAKDPAMLAGMVKKRFNRHQDYATAERRAREQCTGAARGHRG